MRTLEGPEKLQKPPDQEDADSRGKEEIAFKALMALHGFWQPLLVLEQEAAEIEAVCFWEVL